MCGIFCRAKHSSSYNVSDVIKGLKRLEHRGYDSWGMFCCGPLSAKNNKYIGSISNTQNINDWLIDIKHDHYSVCMAHTRWATNGEVNQNNAHPIASRDCKVHVVHNGIIENAQELQNTYKIVTTGTTDTEVVANIIAIHFRDGDYSHDPLAELALIAKDIEGDNAFVIHYQDDDWKFNLFTFVTGNGILYANDGYISSEINALAGFVHNATQLNNDHVYIINRFGSIISDDTTDFAIYDVNIHYVDVPEKHVETETDNPMLSEIKEQSQYFPLGKKLPFAINREHFKMSRIILTGCGSSYYAGMFGQRCFEQIAGIKAQTMYATEFMHCSRLYNADDDYHYICLSQSGETKDTLDAIAPLPFNRLITITNNEHCTMRRYAQNNIHMDVGPEIGVAATKTFFKTCALLAYLAMQQDRWGDRSLAEFEEYIADTIEKSDEWAKNFATIDWTRYLFLGSSLTYPIALEAALKMKEIAYLSAEGMPASEVKHGPIALVDDNTLSVFILSEANKSNMKSILSNIEEIRSRHGQVLIICDWFTHQNYDLGDPSPNIFTLPEISSSYGCEHVISSLACIIPLQLLAYYTAIREGHNPNRPRNLAKCVTV